MRVRRVSTLDSLPPAHRIYLETGNYESSPDTMDTWFFEWQGHDGAEPTWRQLRAPILAAWFAERPGTRPWAWWHFDAPRWPRGDLPARCRGLGDRVLQKFGEPRRRLGGIGDPQYEVLNVIPIPVRHSDRLGFAV